MTTRPTATARPRLSGIWLPLITPFRDGAIDEGFPDRDARNAEELRQFDLI